jgi:hypothetical protein
MTSVHEHFDVFAIQAYFSILIYILDITLESLTPFNECAEFLAFRDYSLDIAPREIFENLPLGNEGISGKNVKCRIF